MSGITGFIAGAFIAMTFIALFTDKIHISNLIFTLPLAIIFSIITWKIIKKEEAEKQKRGW